MDKKNIIFGFGGFMLGAGAGFAAGKFTYKKKLAKAESDIEVLLKEINYPDKDSEVSDEEEEDDEQLTDSVKAEVKETVRPSYDSESKDTAAIDYNTFYSDKGNYIHKNRVGSGVDPAERESPEDDLSEEEDNEDWSSDTRPDDIWESEEEREYRLRQELIDSGVLIDEEHRNYEDGLEMTREMNSGKKPKLITEDSYYDEYPHHQKKILEYYTESDILVDIETEEEIDDEAGVVGNCLDKYDYRNNDMETIIYVRNFSYGIDYQISKIFKRWIPV